MRVRLGSCTLDDMNKLVLVSLVLGVFAFGCITSSSKDEKTAEPQQTAEEEKQQVAEGPEVNVKIDENTIGTSNGTDKGSSGSAMNQ